MINQDKSTSVTPDIKTTRVVYPQIYSYALPDLSPNDGSQKIGYTERLDVDTRIYEQTHTPAFQLNAKKLWSAPAFFSNSTKDFSDKIFHQFLRKNGIENRLDLGKEWFYFNGTPEKSKQLFDTFRGQGFLALQNGSSKIPYELRDEQQDAVNKAIDYFQSHEKGEFLWNAKPRFGKTLASYDLAKQLNAKKVLIVTNRPAIANSWFDDFEMFINGYYFISDTSSLAERKSITREQYNDIDSPNKNMITFLSLQDLKGSKYFGGNHNKLDWVANLDWDLLIIDEAHEGVDTSRTDSAFDIIKRSNTLHLSGTPFKALANQKFAQDAIYNWTYLDEQKEKKKELAEGESGPHADLPDLRLYTYRISQMITEEVNEGIAIDNENRDYAFDLNEFFATTNQKFDHETEVKDFLRNLSTNDKYPFSTPELRDQLRHTFWYVGNRVNSVKALEQLLKQDEVFKDYKIIVAAGDGRTIEEEAGDFKANEKSFDKVKKAIAENPKTITLSCGQLTTGVTVKEWSAVLMLTDIKTPSLYMQAAFRAQNPYRFTEDGQLKAKKSAYLFDFAPTRVLEIYDNFANGLDGKAVNGERTDDERKQNIKELLNFFPVISEDVNGQMVELDAEKVLAFPNALAAKDIVQARFMTNLLFNDNIKGVFHFPKEVEDILDKMDKETGKRVKKDERKLDLDDARKIEQSKQTKINQNTDIILGEKIYRSNIERLVDNAISYETPEETLDTLTDKAMEVAEPLIAKYKITYNATNAEVDEIKQETTEKMRLVVAEYESAEIKDPEKLKFDLQNIIEHDLVQTKVEQQETRVVETIQKSKEDEVREHLRAFTRTIPMFVMANTSRDTITIDNFDEQISDEDFTDLTNITKGEFHMLRDGFDYEENGERGHFGGVFDKYKFNASIAEFVAEKRKRADYFATDGDIFELIPNQKNNQIFTPRRVVKMMIDGLENEQPDLFQRTDSTFVDLYMKSGMYITEIVKKLFANTKHHYNTEADCLKHILENQVYGLSPTGVLHGITNAYIFGFDEQHDISTNNFAMHDLLPQAKDGTAKQKLAELFNGGNDMKFTAVVGNPPYQEEAKGDSSSDDPIYHHFMESAFVLAKKVSLITPARFLFNAGKTPKSWNNKMLNDTHIKVEYFEQKSSVIFPNTDIKGGVVVTFRDAEQEFGAIRAFVHFDELRSALIKVENQTTEFIDTIVTGRNIYRLTSAALKDHPELKNIQSKGHMNDIGSGAFKVLKDVVFFENKPNDAEDYVQVIGLLNYQRVYMWIKRSYLSNPENFEKYKIIVPKANGTGAIGEVLSTPLIGEPLIGFTDTFISIGAFETMTEAEAALKYVKSKFARAMLGVLKITQVNAKFTWAKVPLQDFTATSDIDWSLSIPEIDQQLYKKYGLSEQEIDFIESRVKEMA